MFSFQTESDSELNKAFVEGQDMSMEISVRDSISVISEIQEQLQTDTLDCCNTEVREKKLLLCAVVVCLLRVLLVDTRRYITCKKIRTILLADQKKAVRKF